MDRARVASKTQIVLESIEQLRRLAGLAREEFEPDLPRFLNALLEAFDRHPETDEP